MLRACTDLSRRVAAALILGLALSLAVFVVAPPTAAQGAPGGPAAAHHRDTFIPGRPAPATGRALQPLPHITGSVPVRTDRKLRPGKGTGTSGANSAAVLTPAPDLALRTLVVGTEPTDWGVDTWRSTLDRVGAAYDVLYSRTTALTAASLVRADGTGKYNAILLTSSSQLYDGGAAGFVSGFDATEWNTLWAYERDYGVRQAALYTSYGTFPENYCLAASTEGGVADTPLPAALTTAGAGVFDYLKPTATVPIVQSYVYRTRVTAGCAADPVLVNGADVLGVRTTSADGRERLALTFTSNQNLLQAGLLTYGLLRWATKGMFLGEQRHYLNVDVDDWFNTSDHYFPDGHIESTPGYRMTGHDAFNANQQQIALRTAYPLASGFTFTMAYNGADAVLPADATCSARGGVNTLTPTTRCLRTSFRWINHTYTHQELNFTDAATTSNEITANRPVATALGLSQPNNVLKTGEYSGLGVYNPDPNDDVNPPTDHGLMASNPNLLSAAQAAGVTYLHGNMSFPSHVPACFNCGIVHPMNATITIVPDWPTNIAYYTTTAAEETAFYNAYYGPGGRFPFWPTNLTYAQIIDYEAGVALQHVSSGSIYTHTLHIANLNDYGSGATLATDWARKVAEKYSAYYSVPLLSTAWSALGPYVSSRNAHFAELTAGVDAVWHPGTGTVTVTSPAAGQVGLSGIAPAGAVTYGTDHIAQVTLAAGVTVTVPASPRP